MDRAAALADEQMKLEEEAVERAQQRAKQKADDLFNANNANAALAAAMKVPGAISSLSQRDSDMTFPGVHQGTTHDFGVKSTG